ncbi:hypothetical protein QR680_009774 [Steinernema hermaphroditum]|uniref:Derlin n=1 Tax=Steinernema hermaphroditum TaxID=289476 RepID=A0AA39ILM0_9BILA|nr:hypothetical protein QR680_009774 [Steinernema hermaphroditum]
MSDFGDWYRSLFTTKFHMWRPLTTVNPSSGFHWLFMLYLLYNYGKSTEKDVFTGRPADYLFMLIFNWISCTIVSFAVGIPFLLEPMVVSVLYVWCQLNKDMIMLVLFNMILGGSMVELAGVVVGHIYYFLMYSYPQEFGGASLIKTPQFLYQWLRSSVGEVRRFGSAPESRRSSPRNDGGHIWGRGQQLGST